MIFSIEIHWMGSLICDYVTIGTVFDFIYNLKLHIKHTHFICECDNFIHFFVSILYVYSFVVIINGREAIVISVCYLLSSFLIWMTRINLFKYTYNEHSGYKYFDIHVK